MNKFERRIYDLVKSKPWLKLWIRNVYQSAFDFLPKKKEFSLNPIISKEGYFYGFHDTNPFSNDNSKILANQLSFDLRMPRPEDEIKVGYIEFDGTRLGDFSSIGSTRSWNYHKGCRSQWVNENEIIFNRADENNILRSQIVNLQTNIKRDISFPIDSVSHDGISATNFSYERLQKYMPGYGYEFKEADSFIDQKAPEDTGLFLIHLPTNSRKLLISLKDLAEMSKDEEMSSEAGHYVTHSLFSFDNKYISFLHRWAGADRRRRYTRLVIYNLLDNTITIAPTGYMVSHYVWNHKNQIIAYCNYENQDSHVLLNVEDFSNNHRVAYPRLNSDGHQSFVNDSTFVTDTYPDKHRMARLYKVEADTNNVTLLSSLHSPKKFQTHKSVGHIACDLHPTVSGDGNYVCFDTVKSGKRAIAVMSLNFRK